MQSWVHMDNFLNFLFCMKVHTRPKIVPEEPLGNILMPVFKKIFTNLDWFLSGLLLKYVQYALTLYIINNPKLLPEICSR